MKNCIIGKIHRKNIYLLVVETIMSVCMNFSVILGTGMIAGLVDELLQTGQTQFKSILLPIILCMLAGTTAAYYKRYFSGLYSIKTTKGLYDFAVEKLSKIQYFFFEREGFGKIITRLISDVGELEQYYESTLPDLINNTISIGMVLIYVGAKNKMLMLTALCLYPVALFITYFLGKRLKMLADKRRGKIDVMVERVTDSIAGIEIIRSYNLYDKFVSHIHDAIEDILDNEYVRAWITHFSQTINRLLFWIPNLICPSLAMFMVLRGEMTIGAMMAYIVLMNKIMGGIKMMPFLLNEYRERRISMERVERIFEEEEEKLSEELTDYNDNSNMTSAICFHEVSFSYDTDIKQVLDKMSFRIPKGSVTAFVGESGQGKSTIFKLLCGFYETRDGEILIKGQEITRMGLAAARKQISIVEQEPFLFEGTIYDNIAVGGRKVSQDQVVNASKLAGIHDFIVDLPNQYETVIGENGSGLSGGEKQRIAIARALLKDTPVLLMDEPTSSVDVDTETIIQETVRNLRGKKTIVMIAHRLSTVRDADCIMVVRKGKIWEEGNHEELMRINGIYKKLYEHERHFMKNSEQKGAL